MKWFLSVALLMGLLLSAGCSPDTGPEPASTTQLSRLYTWQPQTLVDTPACGLELESLTLLENGDCQLIIDCQNRTADQVLFSCQDILIDGWLLLDFWGEEFPGYAQRRCQVILPAGAMGDSGPGYPQRLDLSVKVFSQGDLNQAYLCSQSITLYAQQANPGRFESPQSPLADKARVLADNSGCSISMVYTGSDATGQHFTCLLENKTRQRLAFRIHSLRCQEKELDLVWTLQLPPGARCSRELVIPTFEDHGELSLHVQKQDKWFSDVLVNERFRWEADQSVLYHMPRISRMA